MTKAKAAGNRVARIKEAPTIEKRPVLRLPGGTGFQPVIHDFSPFFTGWKLVPPTERLHGECLINGRAKYKMTLGSAFEPKNNSKLKLRDAAPTWDDNSAAGGCLVKLA